MSLITFVLDYLMLKTCPYPGLIENLEFGIEEEISCNINISVIAYAAVSILYSSNPTTPINIFINHT